MSTPPPPAEIQAQAAEETAKKLPIKTYHCRFCSHLLIASTRDLLSSTKPLRRRRLLATGAGVEGGDAGSGGLDGAMILEVPSSSNATRGGKKRKSYDDNGDNNILKSELGVGYEAAAAATPQSAAAAATPAQSEGGKKTEQAHYTIPLSTLVPDPTPVVIRREDGFEKRVLLRCGRCRVVVGYKLPHSNTTSSTTAETEDDFDDDDEEEDEIGSINNGKRDRAIYLLPGSIVGTQDLDVGLDGTAGGPGGDVLHAMIERNPVLKGMEREWMEWVK